MDIIEKEYGKLSLDQFKQLVKELPEVRSQMQELPELVRTASKEKISEILHKQYWVKSWHHAFGLTLCQDLPLDFFAEASGFLFSR